MNENKNSVLTLNRWDQFLYHYINIIANVLNLSCDPVLQHKRDTEISIIKLISFFIMHY